MTTPRGGISGATLQSCAQYGCALLFGLCIVAPVLVLLLWPR